MTEVLHRRQEALTYEEITDFLRRRLGEHLLGTTAEYDTYTVLLDAEGYRQAAELCRDARLLSFDLFDCLFGIDAREEGFYVAAVIYATGMGRRIVLKHLCEGGREAPVAPSLADLYHGANFHEREAWDMFGIEFDGHPGLAPRILCPENFEGWPLRKDFYLATREAKPWPGVKEPAELDEDGNVIERVPGPGDAPGPTALDEAMAKQAKLANPQPEAMSSSAEGELAPEQTATGPGDEPKPASETMPSSTDEGAARPTAKSEQATERVVEGDVERTAEALEEADSRAKQRAEEKRKAAAEARARKAAERQAEQGPVTTPAEDTADVPEDEARDPGTTTAGGPPATAPADHAAEHQPQSPIDTEMGETIDQARAKGTADPDAGEPEITPEGRTLSDGAVSEEHATDEDEAEARGEDTP